MRRPATSDALYKTDKMSTVTRRDDVGSVSRPLHRFFLSNFITVRR